MTNSTVTLITCRCGYLLQLVVISCFKTAERKLAVFTCCSCHIYRSKVIRSTPQAEHRTRYVGILHCTTCLEYCKPMVRLIVYSVRFTAFIAVKELRLGYLVAVRVDRCHLIGAVLINFDIEQNGFKQYVILRGFNLPESICTHFYIFKPYYTVINTQRHFSRNSILRQRFKMCIPRYTRKHKLCAVYNAVFIAQILLGKFDICMNSRSVAYIIIRTLCYQALTHPGIALFVYPYPNGTVYLEIVVRAVKLLKGIITIAEIRVLGDVIWERIILFNVLEHDLSFIVCVECYIIICTVFRFTRKSEANILYRCDI